LDSQSLNRGGCYSRFETECKIYFGGIQKNHAQQPSWYQLLLASVIRPI